MRHTIWEELEEDCRDSNVDLVTSSDECQIMKLENETGEGLMTMYEVFTGIYLIYNDFHMERCQSEFQNRESLFAIDHCREGRIEMEGDGIYYCLEQGDFMIDNRVHHVGKVQFPLRHYHGITIAFQPSYVKEALHEYIPGFDVDLQQLAEKYHLVDNPYVIRKNPSIDHIFAQLYHIPKQSRKDYFRIKIVELLIYLRDLTFDDTKTEKVYFYKSEIEKVHAIHALMMRDLTKHYTQEQLSKRFSMSLTQMKKCFQSVYGQSMYQYLKTCRLNYAAKLLLKENLKVSEAAEKCGYESLAKFGQAFKKQFGVSPMEYRNRNGGKRIHEQ